MRTTRRKGFFGGLLSLALALTLVASLQAVKTTPVQAQDGTTLQELLDWYYQYFGGGSPDEVLKRDIPGTMQRIRLARAEPKECFYRRAWNRDDPAGNNPPYPAPPTGQPVTALEWPYGTPVNGNLLNRDAYECTHPSTAYDSGTADPQTGPTSSSSSPAANCTPGYDNPNRPPPPAPEPQFLTDCTGIPKVNESYVWSMTKGTSSQVWFGTAPNVLCTASAEIFGLGGGSSVDDTDACEGGRSMPAHNDAAYPDLSNAIGDWRPPVIYRYNLNTGQKTDKTPNDPLINETFGLRAAHSHGGVVFLAGPSTTRSSVNMFAFKTDGTYLGSHEFENLANIRRFTVAGNKLYAAVGVDPSTLTSTGDKCQTGLGNILRWRGSASDPFNFQRVGCVAGEAVEIAAHEGRLYITDWPPVVSSGGQNLNLDVQPGVWMSPRLGTNGLNATSALSWNQASRWSEYERSPALSKVYGGGPLISYGGKLIVTSIHFPFANVVAHLLAERFLDECPTGDAACVGLFGGGALAAEREARCGGPRPPSSMPAERAAWDQCASQLSLEYTLAAQRPTVMLRLDNLDTTSPSKEVLYGMPVWPIWDSTADDGMGGQGAFVIRSMPLGFPRYGLAGYGNFFNNYTWGLAIQNNRLFATTFDFGELFGDEDISPDLSLNELRALRQTSAYGGDVIRFDSPTTRGQFEVAGGADNRRNYGFRSILPLADGVLLGSGNPFNLATDPDPNGLNEGLLGGWELIKLRG